MTHHGSNVDLGTAVEIDAALQQCSAALDAALDLLQLANQEWADATNDYEAAFGSAFAGIAAPTVTERKARADMQTLASRHERDVKSGVREYAKALVRSRQSQLSAAQTRAKLLMTQLEFDRSAR